MELLHADGYDTDQNVLTWILINHKLLDFKAAFPDVFDQVKIALEIIGNKKKKKKKKQQIHLGEIQI